MRSVEPPAPARTWPESFGRLHQGETLRLHLRNLYIVPTRFGGLWLAGAILLQVVGIQTQRNGPLLLSFLMLALLLLALLLTHANLQGLELRCAEPRAGFAGEPLTYPLQVLSDSPRDAIDLRLEAGAAGLPQRLNAGSNPVELGWRCNQRGWHAPSPLLIRSTAPLGLFVCWSRWQPPARQLVYPARRPGPVALAAASPERPGAPQAAAASREGSEHWQTLRPHRPQDSQSRLAWKALAQGRGRLTKVFLEPGGQPPLLTLASAVPHERALEHLCAAVWQHSQGGGIYGLVLPEERIAPGQGRQHRDRCLRALALSR
jgi:uncharacterized protein (DUF58 family)